MELTADFHTHTKYSDGENTIAENVARAKELGLKAIAITEHGFSHLAFGIRRREKDKFIREIKEAREKYDFPVLVGIEANIQGREGTCDLTEADFADFDVYLSGFHLASRHEKFRDFLNNWKGFFCYHGSKKPSKRLIADTTKAYINAVKRNPLDVITHINYLVFSDPVEVAKCCADYGTYLEISGKKTHLTDEQLAAVCETGVRFVINSDAHSIARIGDVALAQEQIVRVGVPLDRIDNIDGRMPNFRLAEYKKHHC